MSGQLGESKKLGSNLLPFLPFFGSTEVEFRAAYQPMVLVIFEIGPHFIPGLAWTVTLLSELSPIARMTGTP
jgi:hypothetical protein